MPGVAVVEAPGARSHPLDLLIRQNRFVGNHLLYGAGSGWYAPAEGVSQQVFVTRHDRADPVVELRLDHAAERIEVLGSAAIVIGQGGRDLHFSSIALDARPVVADTFVRTNSSQGETRSHGFFFDADPQGGGVLGLPVRLSGGAYQHLLYGSAEVTFLGVDRDHNLRALGALTARDDSTSDACTVSCVDWYGNARPIFYRDRVFALMGYELIEAQLTESGVDEIARVDYGPGRTR